MSYLDRSIHKMTSCEVGNGPILKFTFIPKREHFGQNIRITFFPDVKSTYSGTGQILLNTTVQVSHCESFFLINSFHDFLDFFICLVFNYQILVILICSWCIDSGKLRLSYNYRIPVTLI